MTIKGILKELSKNHKALYGKLPFNDNKLVSIRRAIRILEKI